MKRLRLGKVKKTITAKLPRVLVGPFEVCVKVPAEGRLGRDSAMNGDFLMEFTVPSGPGDPAANLSRALADLARFYAGVTDDMGGTAEIIIEREVNLRTGINEVHARETAEARSGIARVLEAVDLLRRQLLDLLQAP